MSAATGFFAFDRQTETVQELPHGVEVMLEVYYRTSPDEPRGAHRRIFSSIAKTERMAWYYAGQQRNAWERAMRGEAQP